MSSAGTTTMQPTHLFPQLLLECPLVPVQLSFSLCKLILLQLEGQFSVCLQRCDVVLLLVQQVLDLLLIDLQPSEAPSTSR